MANSPKKETTVNKVQKKPLSKGLTPKQIVKRHIQNENDLITEDDMKNVKIDSSLQSDQAHQPLEISSDTERPKDEDKDNKTRTPWDVISE
jgi:hypothetical protein